MTVLVLPPPGSPFWRDGEANLAALPASGAVVGEARIAVDTGSVYYWTGSAWALITAAASSSSVRALFSATAPILYNSSTGVFSLQTSGVRALFSGTSPILYDSATGIFSLQTSGVRALFSGTAPILYDSATGTFSLQTSGVRALFSGTSPILYDSATGIVSIQVASGSQNGYLSSTDWTTFNAKEPAITSGTTAQYWRGDKSFQALNIAALSSVTDGSTAASGKISEILTGTQASNTSTGVGSTGTWGAATSVSLTAGRWLVWATAGFNENGSTLTTSLSVGISSSSTGSGIDEFATTQAPFETSGANDAVLSSPPTPVNISSTTTYYANTRFYYTSGSPQHRGRITAQRIG